MSEFDDATAVERSGDGAFDWEVPDGWQQGRGAWGGLVVGALARAIVAAEPEADRRLRSVSAQIPAPVLVGVHRIAVQVVRRGTSMSTWSAQCQDAAGRAVASMVAVLGGPRDPVPGPESADWGVVSAPPARPADEVPLLPMGPPLGPVFAPHCRMHPITGIPLSGGMAESIGWVGYAEPTEPTDIALLALVDAWWPASLPMLRQMSQVATVNFLANLLVDPSTIAAGELLLNHSFVTAAADGFSSEHRRLWTADRRLAVDNVQTMVVGG